MTNRKFTPVLSVLMLALAAGTAAPAGAQMTGSASQKSAVVAPTVDFRSSKWLSDRKVVNANGEEIAVVSDLILERGWGRIEYLVIKTGTTLGLGGRAVAIPYAAFKWDSAAGKDAFVLASTPEQLKLFPEYTAESWKAMKESVSEDKSALRQRLAADAAMSGDPYAGTLNTAKEARISGEVKSVERVRTTTFGEQIVISVLTADGATKRIALGPSWYVNGAAAAPMRGDKVVVDTLALPRDPDQLLAGTHLRTGERQLHLRESDGSPAWALKTVESGGHTYSTPYSRYLLVSSLHGMKIDCRGIDGGKVQDIILDRNSGEIGFLSIDPNQNFLGIGDTKRMIPWSVATVALDGTVRVDASKDMVLASPETPSDLSTLNTGTHAERVYKAFDVPAPRFQAPRPVTVLPPQASDAWAARGSILAAIEGNSTEALSGSVVDLSEVKFEQGVQPARAVKIRTQGEGSAEELVLLGPAWYMQNQKPICKVGDSIQVRACRTTIDGHRYWIARSVECKDARVVMLDESNSPVWNQP